MTKDLNSPEMSDFALSIMEQKYSHTKPDGTKESWEEIAKRVAKHVMKAVNAPSQTIKNIERIITERKFMPGGRYLYASGRPFHQVQNCLLMRAEDSREGWSELLQKSSMALMTGAGIGIDYSKVRAKGKPIRKTGGVATGPLALMEMVNEAGRGIMQGGSRRSAIWAGLSWKHPDIHQFITLKNWMPEVRELKEKYFDFPATMDGTNISVILDDEFFKCFKDEKSVLHSHAQSVYWSTVEQMLKTAEPGFSVNTGVNSGETLRNACVTGNTEILTKYGYEEIQNLLDKDIEIWNGFEWSTVTPATTGIDQPILNISFSDGRELNCTPYHKFHISTDYRGSVEIIEAKNLQIGMKLIKHDFPVLDSNLELQNAYTTGFIAAEGMESCKTFYVYPPKEMCLSRLEDVKFKTKEENNKRYRLRLNNTPFSKSFVPVEYSIKSKVDWLAGLFDGDGTELKEGGCQLTSINLPFLQNVQKLLSTLSVQSKIARAQEEGYRPMPDQHGGHKEYFCQKLYRICIRAVQIQVLKQLGLKCERLSFDKTPQRDASQFVTVIGIREDDVAEKVYCFNEPNKHLGVFNGVVTGQCTEVSSYDDSDICNLGSINLARIASLEEMTEVVELATMFLLAGTIYSDVPYAEVDKIRTKNRRLGLGIMGIHEWLLLHGKKYGPDVDLEEYLNIYATSTDIAERWANEWDISVPVKTRAIAPTGTIGIVAETTTGIEPIFCVAYKRRYKKAQGVTAYQYVLDPTAKKLIDSGVIPDTIEDAYTLAEDVERRIAFQAWVQQFVDHGISSTVNIPFWGSEQNNSTQFHKFGDMLIKYLPNLRGMTVYPDGARGGQPITAVKYATASKHIGEVFIEQMDVCDLTHGGTCGS